MKHVSYTYLEAIIIKAMKKSFLYIFLFSMPLLTKAQVNNDINITELIREIQQWNKTDNKISLAWWVPNEYWSLALQGDKRIPKETVKQLENAFGDYVLIWACDLNINLNGTMNFTSGEEIRKTISVVDKQGKVHHPLEKNQITEEALIIVENMKPYFAQAIGQVGEGIYPFFFQIKDKNKENLINATLPGQFRVSHSNSEFLWKLPLVTLLPPKFCTVDNEKMKGNWLYCPIHGQKLK